VNTAPDEASDENEEIIQESQNEAKSKISKETFDEANMKSENQVIEVPGIEASVEIEEKIQVSQNEAKPKISKAKKARSKKTKTAFECKLCGVRFLFICQMNLHLKLDHEIQGSYQEAQIPETFSCTKCDKTFLSSADLYQHENSAHISYNTVACKFCDKMFQSVGSMRTHLFHAHGDEAIKEFKFQIECDICEKVFNSQSILNKHCYQHQVMEEYTKKWNSCSVCDSFGFKSRHELMLHMRQEHHHPKVTFYCPKCFETFPRRYNIIHHCERVHLMTEIELIEKYVEQNANGYSFEEEIQVSFAHLMCLHIYFIVFCFRLEAAKIVTSRLSQP
jgi:uncharacterized C2H2 Zn-finger protein